MTGNHFIPQVLYALIYQTLSMEISFSQLTTLLRLSLALQHIMSATLVMYLLEILMCVSAQQILSLTLDFGLDPHQLVNVSRLHKILTGTEAPSHLGFHVMLGRVLVCTYV